MLRVVVLSGAFRWCIVVCLLVALATPQAGALKNPYDFVKREPIDRNWYWGNLTWTEGKGGISWGRAVAPAGLAGHGVSNPNAPAEPDVFVSDPLPMPLYLNVSRGVQLSIAIRTSTTCNGPMDGVTVRMTVGGQLLAAGIDSGSPKGPSYERKVPAGFRTCHWVFPLEMSFVPAGSVIRFEFVYLNGAAYQYGVGDGQESFVWLPVFDPGAALYRMPEVIPRHQALFVGQRDDGSPGLILIPGLALGLLRRRGAPVASLLLATLALSGCLGHTTPEASPPALGADGALDVTQLEAWDDQLASAGTGGIVGQVRDANQVPVAGAAVAVLRTAHFTQTDAYGVFQFAHLQVGEHRLRFDQTGFKSREVSVRVEASKVAQVEVELAWEVELRPDQRAHRHDYWVSETSRVVLDAPIVAECYTIDCHEDDGFFVPSKDPDAFNLIRPGTNEVEVRLTFEPEKVGFRRLGLWIQANDASDPGIYRYYYPRASGEVFRVRSTWEMTDAGHQAFSTWQFGIFVFGEDALPTSGIAGTDVGRVTPDFRIDRAHITIHKGTLPLEPPHPDHWSGKDRLVLDAERKWWMTYYGTLVVGLRSDVDGRGGCFGPDGGANAKYYRDVWADLGRLSKVVPEHTRTVVLTVVQNRPSGLQGNYEWGWELWYAPGNVAPTTFDPGVSLHRKGPAPTLSSDGLTYTWRIPVEPHEVDGLYNRRSAWDFHLVPTDQQAACMDAHRQPIGSGMPAPLQNIQLTWGAEALRGPG